jgi:hypothetical protein
MTNLFPIPKISAVLHKPNRFTYATAIDLNMGYCTISWTLIHPKYVPFPLGWKYSCQQLPMGIACSPDIFQAKMSELMVTLEFI